MSQSLHATPTPHFGCHFDGHMNAKPFAQQQDNGGPNLNRKKSVAHVAEYDQKEDVKADQLQKKKGQGFETKKSSAAPQGDALHETTDVKDDLANNCKNQAASDDNKPLDARPLQEIINERRISQGKKPITNEECYREINHLDHCPTCRSFFMPPAPRTIDYELLAADGVFRRQVKQEKDRAKNGRILPRPEHPPPIDPQKAWDYFYKNRPYLKRPA